MKTANSRRSRHRSALLGLMSLLLVSLAGHGVGFAVTNVGDPAPDFTLQDVSGTSYSLSDFSDQVTVLFFVGYG